MTSGYYRFPTIHDDRIVFVSEDDLWTVDFAIAAAGSDASPATARRLTSNLGAVTDPAFSPDGTQLAFVGREEGAAEIYVMPAVGGAAHRLTYLSSRCRVIGWDPSGTHILFSSNHGQNFEREQALFRVAAADTTGTVEQLPVGPARAIAYGPNGEVVLGRNTGDPAQWKRYRGGTVGHFWIDQTGTGDFQRFLGDIQGNIASPMWIKIGDVARLFFVSDHEGIGNVYSVQADGRDLQRHTDHEDYYVRNPSSDGKRIVYHAGADLYVYDPARDIESMVPVAYHSPRVQRNRKFVSAARYLQSVKLHPTGLAVAATTRGKSFAFYNFEGPVIQMGKRDGVRYRLTEWLNDGRRMVAVSDEPGEEVLEIFSADPEEPSLRLDELDIGRVHSLKVSPIEDKVALVNHRYELLIVDLEEETLTLVERSPYRNIGGFDWSPDGRWLAYSCATSPQTTAIRLYQLPEEEVRHPAELPADAVDADTAAPDAVDSPDTAPNAAGPSETAGDAAADEPEADAGSTVAQGQIYTITQPVLNDIAPAFDPRGRYLYFLSYREFNPVYDGLHFDLGFPWGMRPYLITLQDSLPNPFIPRPDMEDADGDDADEDDADEDDVPEDDDSGEDDAGGDGGVGDTGDDDDGLEGDALDDDALDDEEEDEAGDDSGDGDVSEDDPADGIAGDVTHARANRSLAAQGPHRVSADAAAGTEPAPQESSADVNAADAAFFDDVEKPSVAADAGADDEPPPELRNTAPRLRIDLAGIERRVLAFPVPDGRYGRILGLKDKVLFTEIPIHGQLDGGEEWDDEGHEEYGTLRAYNFKDYKSETLAEGVSWFSVSRNGKKLLYGSGPRVRVIAAGEKPPGSSGPPRKTGWIDLARVKVSVDPQSEWEQMFREAWRLQRDQFWSPDMNQVDWETVYNRYFPLIRRVSTRVEFSDLMWEMQGELGTSHAYEFGGDHRGRPHYSQGFLGAEIAWDQESGGYRIGTPIVGDSWEMRTSSPLTDPGVDVKAGDVIVAVNGQAVDAEIGPAQLLVNQAGQEVLLTLAPRAEQVEPGADKARKGERNNGRSRLRQVAVRTLANETPVRYRAWVEQNRALVHSMTDGRVGYVHIPDMGPRGYAEFHRGYLAETAREALIVDVRYNGGGHVSQLILEKLARRRIGYDLSRWGGLLPYPQDSVAGPLVAVTNEHAGSDGDIFCHSFKLMNLGPLIGTRTWGGVVGISPRHALVDGTITTQPEFSFWFQDVGWNVENYGTEPDIEVEITPQDYRVGRDPQLEQAVAEISKLLADTPPQPDLGNRPSRALPKLPPRTNSKR